MKSSEIPIKKSNNPNVSEQRNIFMKTECNNI